MKLRKIYYYTFRVFTFLIIALGLFSKDSSISRAQQGFWSTQEKIPDYFDFTEEPPYLIADQNHKIHAFNSQPIDIGDGTAPKVILYRNWTMENGWSIPNDIQYDEGGGDINLVGVTSDESGIVHIVFQGANKNLYYSNAYLAQASSPNSWSEPQLVAEQVTGISPGIENIGAIASDSVRNKLIIIYSGSEYGNGLYFIISLDHGNTWSDPYPLSLVRDENLLVTDPELFVGNSGDIHAVWSTFSRDGFGGPGYYSRLGPEKQTWSEPVDLDIPGIRTPAIIEYMGEVYVSYHHIISNGNWWRRSSDGGQTWTHPSQISSRHVGTNGGVSFVVDSNNVLHAFFGGRINDNNHGMWHIVWTGTSWTNPEAVVKGKQIIDVIGENGFDPRSARAVVSNGNVVLVTWGTDGAAGENGAWYSYKILDAPELPGQALFLPENASLEIGVIEAPKGTNIEVEQIPDLAVEKDREIPKFIQNPQFPIFLGIIPVVVFLVGFIFYRGFTYTRNK